MIQKFISTKDGKIVIDFPAYKEEEELHTFQLKCLSSFIREMSSYEYLDD